MLTSTLAANYLADPDSLSLGLLVLRVLAGVSMAAHGYQKFFKGGKIDGTAGWFDSMGMRPGRFHAILAASTELGAGLLFALGLLTPLAALAIVVGANAAIVGTGVAAIFIGYTSGSAVGVGLGLGAVFVAVALATDETTMLGMAASLGLVVLVQLERSVSMRRAAQPDDRVRRAGIAVVAIIICATFLVVGTIELIRSDEVGGFQLPFGLTITAAVVAVVARQLDTADTTSNAEAFRPGSRH